MSLKSELVRIANEHPETRKHLMPLLREAGGPMSDTDAEPMSNLAYVAGRLVELYSKLHNMGKVGIVTFKIWDAKAWDNAANEAKARGEHDVEKICADAAGKAWSVMNALHQMKIR